MNYNVAVLILLIILTVIAFYPFKHFYDKVLGAFSVVILLVSILGAWG